MRFFSLSVSSASGLLAATAWIPSSESFLSVSLSSGHNKIDFENNIQNSAITNHSNNKKNIQHNMVKRSNDDMIAAQEAEARKICPLLPPPEDVHSTFEAAMG